MKLITLALGFILILIANKFANHQKIAFQDFMSFLLKYSFQTQCEIEDDSRTIQFFLLALLPISYLQEQVSQLLLDNYNATINLHKIQVTKILEREMVVCQRNCLRLLLVERFHRSYFDISLDKLDY